MSEMIGVMLCLKNPLARLSRTETKGTIFSAFGELLWYLSKDNNLKFITYYIKQYKEETEDFKTIYGGYGPRLFNSQKKYNQVKNIIRLLRENPSSRRAVIQLFEAKDIERKHKEIPCTCTLQFINRGGALHMITYMRSNDAFLGLPHDIFTFTMLQEIIARSLCLELGTYNHSVGSLHLYENKKQLAQTYLDEGFQSTKKPMPIMPNGDPWPSVNALLNAEARIRHKKKIEIDDLRLDPYWIDLVRLLQIYSLFKDKDHDAIIDIKKGFSSNIYDTYVDKRLSNL
jgi:thymidylate synthase